MLRRGQGLSGSSGPPRSFSSHRASVITLSEVGEGAHCHPPAGASCHDNYRPPVHLSGSPLPQTGTTATGRLRAPEAQPRSQEVLGKRWTLMSGHVVSTPGDPP